MILSGSMERSSAIRLIECIDPEKPWYRPADFVNAMAAFATVYRHEVDRKTHLKGKKLYAVLWSATAPQRMQWYFNNMRGRHFLPEQYQSMVSSGTSTVESLNHEVNTWFQNMPEVYAPTLRLELRINRLKKLLTHNTAMYRPQLRKLSQQTIAAACHSSDRLTDSAWVAWCKSTQHKDVSGPALPLHVERQKHKHIVTTHERKHRTNPDVSSVKKKPAKSGKSFKRPAAILPKKIAKNKVIKKIKRHPFNLKRVKVVR